MKQKPRISSLLRTAIITGIVLIPLSAAGLKMKGLKGVTVDENTPCAEGEIICGAVPKWNFPGWCTKVRSFLILYTLHDIHMCIMLTTLAVKVLLHRRGGDLL